TIYYDLFHRFFFFYFLIFFYASMLDTRLDTELHLSAGVSQLKFVYRHFMHEICRSNMT
ncbi:hypothetical protein L9F63_002197, partial [Diploptera punctata]